MAWLSRVNFIASDTLSFTDINNLGNDIRAWGDNVNGGGYTLSNVIVSASSGIMPVVTGGGAAGSTLTLRSTSVVGTTDAIIFQTGTQVERARISSSGTVSVGNAVNNSLRRLEFITASGGSTAIESVTVGATDQALAFKTTFSTESEKMRILGNGNVGIATQSPGSRFQVAGSTSFGALSANSTGSGYVSSITGSASKTSASDGTQLAMFSSDALASNPLMLTLGTVGNATAANRYAYVQTGEYGSGAFPILAFQASGGNVAVGTTTPAASTALDITSTTGALLVPRMTTTQRNALTATNGMILYNTTDNQMQARVNGAWVAL
jgi:hypothetical protein